MTMLMALAAHGGCTAGTEYMPPLCPTGLPAVRRVVIERAGHRAYREDGDRVACAAFKPTATQVKRFFATAKTVDQATADATLDRSPCQASGTITFVDGSKGRWTIEQLRVGMLTRGRTRTLLFCQACRTRPFIW